MKKFISRVLIICFILIDILVGYMIFKKFTPEKKIHYHAGFVVFQNNKKLNFSDNIYMNIEPCTLKKDIKTESAQEIQLEKAHLHDNIGDVLHIERSGATWKDLFTNIKYPLSNSSSKGFINGKEIVNFQSHTIQPNESLVVFIGNNNKLENLQQAPSKEYMDNMAKKSKTCGE